MNQRQIRYLDERIKMEEARLSASLTEKHLEFKKRSLRKLVDDFLLAYKERLFALPKEEIARRFMIVVSEACREYNDWGSYSKNGIIDLTNSCNVNERDNDMSDLLDIDGIIPKWNKKAGELEVRLNKEAEEAHSRLADEIITLRDRINLGDASEAITSLEQFVVKWTKLIEDIDKTDEPCDCGTGKQVKHGKGRK